MGAIFNVMRLPGTHERRQVVTAFAEEQRLDRYENGHSYSGGFGMAAGLKFASRSFETKAEAKEWLEANCRKWDAALAVTFLNDNREATWLIGAWCSS